MAQTDDAVTRNNRIALLRKLYWQNYFRLPTQAEFEGLAYERSDFDGSPVLVPETDWARITNDIPGSPRAQQARRDHNNDKPSTRTPPAGYDFGTSEDVDPKALDPNSGSGSGSGSGTAKNAGETINDYLVRMLNTKDASGGTRDRDAAIALAATEFNLPPGADGSPFYYSNNGTIGLKTGYLVLENGQWKNVPRGPEGPKSTDGPTAAAKETPAERAARLATFGLGPEGLQNQRPGEAPTPRTLGDLMQPQGPIQNPGTYTPGAAYQAPEYQAPAPYQQATPFGRDEYQAATPFGRDEYQAATPFAAPTAADMGQDPGYQFRLSEGQKALERSGAARGVTNTGGTLKGILDYGQQAASQEYGNVYSRNLNTYNTNEANRAGAYQTNYGNALNAYNANEANRAGAYQTNYGNAFGAYNANEANRAGAYNTNAQNAYQQYSTNALAQNAYNQDTEARRSGAFGTNTGLYQQQQADAYNRSQQAYNDAVAAFTLKTNQQRQYERDRMNDIQYAAGA